MKTRCRRIRNVPRLVYNTLFIYFFESFYFSSRNISNLHRLCLLHGRKGDFVKLQYNIGKSFQ